MNPYLPRLAKIEKIKIETEDKMLKTFELSFLDESERKKFDFKPGQFCEISVFGKGEAPFGIASSPTEDGPIMFTVNKAGVVTTALHNLYEGDIVGLRGPLGNSYPIELFKGKNIVIVGGGFAFTTLRALTVYMLDNRGEFGEITVVYGARTPGMFLYKEELSDWERRDDLKLYLTIDKPAEGWEGKVGLVPSVLEEVAPSSEDAFAVVCGPPIMIKFTLPVLDKLGFKPEQIYTSLEMRMKCGIGKCGRGNIGHLYVCKDGPVFSYAQLRELPMEY